LVLKMTRERMSSAAPAPLPAPPEDAELGAPVDGTVPLPDPVVMLRAAICCDGAGPGLEGCCAGPVSAGGPGLDGGGPGLDGGGAPLEGGGGGPAGLSPCCPLALPRPVTWAGGGPGGLWPLPGGAGGGGPVGGGAIFGDRGRVGKLDDEVDKLGSDRAG